MDEFMPLLGCRLCFTVIYFNFLVTAQILRDGDREGDRKKQSRVMAAKRVRCYTDIKC